MKNLFKKSNLKYLIAFLIPAVVVLFSNGQIDNDSWDVIAEGREIAMNGIYYTDRMSMHEGLNVTVQNYGFAVLFYYVYSLLGPMGLYVIMILLNFLICFLLYKIFMLMSDKNKVLSLILMTVAGSLLGIGFVVTRAQLISFVIFLAVIYIFERYTKTGKVKWFWLIPILSLLQINLHASLWPMIFLVGLVFAFDAPMNKYKIKPILIVITVAFLVGFLNPYSWKMMILVVASYTNGALQSFISELQPFSLATWYARVIYVVLAIVLTMCFYGDKKEIKARYILMFLGFLALGLNTFKGMSQVILTMMFPFVAAYKDLFRKPLKLKKAKGVFARLYAWRGGVVGVVMIGLFVGGMVMVSNTIRNDPGRRVKELVDVLDEQVGDKTKSELKIYTGFDDGGYLEFRGYKPYLDPRAEVFLAVNNGKEDILNEWLVLRHRKTNKAEKEFLEKYKFDYLVATGENDPLYDIESEEYELIYEDEEYANRLYRKV